MKHVSLTRALVALAAFSAVVGCSNMRLPGPGGSPPQMTDDELVAFVGDVGVGCGLAPAANLDPATIAKVQLGIAAAAQVMTQDKPSLDTIAAAFASAGVPPRYVNLSAVAVTRLRAHLGAINVIPKDSVGYRCVAAFLDTCSLALGTGGDVAAPDVASAGHRLHASGAILPSAAVRTDLSTGVIARADVAGFQLIADPTLLTAADRIAARAQARALASQQTAAALKIYRDTYANAQQSLPPAARRTAIRTAYNAYVHQVDVIQQQLHARLVQIGPEPGATMPAPGSPGVNFISYDLAA